jgi:hypothetical protein
MQHLPLIRHLPLTQQLFAEIACHEYYKMSVGCRSHVHRC